MAHAGVHHLRVACGRAVPPAVGWRAQKGSALHHFAGDADGGLGGIEGTLDRGAARVVGGAAALGHAGIGALRPRRRVPRAPPIGGPFPDISAGLEQPVAIRREGPHRAGPCMPIGFEVPPRERALPGVGEMHPAGRQFLPPREFRAVQPAARGVFPLGFGGQVLAGPAREGLCVLEGDMDDGVVLPPLDGAAGAFGVAPLRARRPMPPMGDDGGVHRPVGHAEHQRARRQHLGLRARIEGGVERSLGDRDMAGGGDEGGKGRVGHGRRVHPEAVHRGAVLGPLLGVVAIRSHQEAATGDADHAGGRDIAPRA